MQLPDLQNIHNNYRNIVLSPHFDDAALSCGGLAARYRAEGQQVLVVTMCTATPTDAPRNPLAREFHDAWGLPHDAVVATRRQEDAAAMAALDCDYVYLDLLDAIYRHPTYDSRERLFGPPDAADSLPAALDLALKAIASQAPQATFYCPLAIGLHVDHQQTFLACQRLQQAGRSVAFYEDIPYVLTPGNFAQRMDQIGSNLSPRSVEIGEWLGHKQRSIAAYASQMSELFGSVAAMPGAVADYAAAVRPEGGRYGERLWA